MRYEPALYQNEDEGKNNCGQLRHPFLRKLYFVLLLFIFSGIFQNCVFSNTVNDSDPDQMGLYLVSFFTDIGCRFDKGLFDECRFGD